MSTKTPVSAKPETLQSFVGRHAAATPLLPLTHVRRLRDFHRLRTERVILPRKCDVFGEELVYLFYGRAAYRPAPGRLPSSQAHAESVCLILRPAAVDAVRGVYPFDTGAFRNYYGHAVATDMEPEDFRLPARLESASRTVTAFYAHNEAYLNAEPATVELKSTDTVCQAYGDLIRQVNAHEMDDRCSAVEVQTSAPVELAGNVLAVVASHSEAAQLKELRGVIPWLGPEVKILRYRAIGRSNSDELYGRMREKADDWLIDTWLKHAGGS